MDITQLKAFVVTGRLLHFTKAAERLNVSQPTISGQIRSLEEEFGIKLFSRSATGVALTKQGADLLEEAQAVLNAAENFRRAAISASAAIVPNMTVGIVLSAELVKLAKVLGHPKLGRTKVHFNVRQGTSEWIVQKMTSGELDVGFYLGRVDLPNIESVALTDVEFVLIAPSSWKDQMQDATWADVAAMPWIWAPEGVSRYVSAELSRRGLSVGNRTEVDRESTLVDLVSAQRGIGFARETLAEAEIRKGNVFVWNRERFSIPLYAAALRSRAKDHLVANFLLALADSWDIEPRQTEQ